MKCKYFGTYAAILAFLLFPSNLLGSYPQGYYDSLNGKKGVELKKAVKAAAAKGFSAISYGDDTWDAFLSTDVRTVNGQRCWWDMYSDNNVTVASGHPGMNIEHSVANSWWGGTKNNAYKDIVHLNPSDADANNRKSNYPLGEVGSSTWSNGVTFVGKPGNSTGGGASYVYEPHDMYKGDFARVFMYMFTLYDDIAWRTTSGYGYMYDPSDDYMFKSWAAEMLLRWVKSDPVSDKEIARNEGIYKEQHNRNPFIDLPDLAEYIWGAKKGEAYKIDGAGGGTDPDPEPPGPVDPSGEEGTWTLVTSASHLEAGARYVLAGAESNTVMSYTLSTGSAKYMEEGSALQLSGSSANAIPGNAAVITLAGTSGAWCLGISDKNGTEKGWLGSSAAKTMTLTDSPSTTASITIADNGDADITYGANTLYHNVSATRFTTYNNLGTWGEHLRMYKYIAPINTGVEDIETEDDTPLVEVWGNNILVPEGAVIYNLSGVRTSGENLAPGLYIVVKPTFSHPVKVMIK